MASPPATLDPGAPDYGSVQPTFAPAETQNPAPQKKRTALGIEEQAKGVVSKFLKDLPGLLVPWFLFAVVLWSVALPTDSVLGYISLVAAMIASVYFVALTRSRPWFVVALVCLASTLLGFGLGIFDRYKYMYPYLLYSRAVTYTNVATTDEPGAYRDAGLMTFGSMAYVDAVRSVGYSDDETTWCVAPIMDSTAQMEAGFWAVGTDCCDSRGAFRCNIDSTGQYGVVVIDGGINTWESPYYTTAVNMAAITYGVELTDSAVVLVRWGTSLDAEMSELYVNAVAFALVGVLLFLLSVPAIEMVLTLLRLPLMNRPSSPSWYPDQASVLVFGVSIDSTTYPDALKLDLLNKRTHWTGEVVLDYAFHLANTSSLLGIFISHPAHPYNKLERSCIFAVVGLLAVFLSALVRDVCDVWPLRLLVVLFLALLSRNVLRAYVNIVGQKEERLRGEQVDVFSARVQRSVFLGSVLLFTAIACAVIIIIIGTDNFSLVYESLDGLLALVVLELLIDCLLPFVSENGHGERTWGLGFFGRWAIERDEQQVEYYGSMGHIRPHEETHAAGATLRADWQMQRKNRRSTRERDYEVGPAGGGGGGAGALLTALPAPALDTGAQTPDWERAN